MIPPSSKLVSSKLRTDSSRVKDLRRRVRTLNDRYGNHDLVNGNCRPLKLCARQNLVISDSLKTLTYRRSRTSHFSFRFEFDCCHHPNLKSANHPLYLHHRSPSRSTLIPRSSVTKQSGKKQTGRADHTVNVCAERGRLGMSDNDQHLTLLSAPANGVKAR
jgi:hypothetical protein